MARFFRPAARPLLAARSLLAYQMPLLSSLGRPAHNMLPYRELGAAAVGC